MQEFTILIPVLRDDNRQSHCPTLWESWENRLLQFGGFTMQGESVGCWKDSEGKVIRDVSRRYCVAVTDFQVGELHSAVAHYGALFGQQCIYIAQTSDSASLLECPNYRQMA